MSFIKKLFNKTPQQRAVKSVNDLRINDVIVLSDSFGLPELLRDKQFQVSTINSYEFEHFTQTEWVLSGESDCELFLSLDVDDKSYLKFSLKIAESDVGTLFDLDEFAGIFEQEQASFLERASDSNKTSGWSDEAYRQQTFAQVGFFHRKDHRSQALSQYEGQDAGEQFELYTLFNQDESKGIDIEVWQDGDTDVFLTLFRPMTDIVDMYPGS